MQRSATPTSTDARVTVQTTPRPSSSAKSRPADSENVAFASLSNAVLELFDKTVETAGVQPSERETLSQQITTRAAEVVETLKVTVFAAHSHAVITNTGQYLNNNFTFSCRCRYT